MNLTGHQVGSQLSGPNRRQSSGPKEPPGWSALVQVRGPEQTYTVRPKHISALIRGTGTEEDPLTSEVAAPNHDNTVLMETEEEETIAIQTVHDLPSTHSLPSPSCSAESTSFNKTVSTMKLAIMRLVKDLFTLAAIEGASPWDEFQLATEAAHKEISARLRHRRLQIPASKGIPGL